jgi:hypothetical protein
VNLPAGAERWSPTVGKPCPTGRRIAQITGVIIPRVQQALNEEDDMPLTDDDVRRIVDGINTLGSAAGGDLLAGFILRIRQYLQRDLGFATAAQIGVVVQQMTANAASVAGGIRDSQSAVLGYLAGMPTGGWTDEQRAELVVDIAAKVPGLEQDRIEAALRHVFADAGQPDPA